MAFAYKTYSNLTGAQTDFPIDFDYEFDNEIKVELDGVLITDYSIISGGILRFNVAPTGSIMELFRETDLSKPRVTLDDDTGFLAEDLNNANTQLINAAQEVRDLSERFVLREDTLDFKNVRGTRVGDPTANTDATNKQYVDAKFADVDTSVAAAQAAQAAAESAQTSSETSATAATTAKTAAETAKTTAETAKTDAETASAKAQQWAEEVEDTEVETGKYSAKHWAAKAAVNAAGSAATTSYNNTTSGLTATNVQAAVDELDSTLDSFNAVPSGTIAAFAASTPPTDWLECDGAAISRTTYAALFAAIGTTFGAGDGSTTFNLPDLRGEFIRGFDNGRGVDSGRVFGSDQAGANQAHTHTGSTNTTGNHGHSYVRPGSLGYSPSNPGGTGTANATTGSAGSHSHTLTINSEGSEARPRNIALSYIIKY